MQKYLPYIAIAIILIAAASFYLDKKGGIKLSSLNGQGYNLAATSSGQNPEAAPEAMKDGDNSGEIAMKADNSSEKMAAKTTPAPNGEKIDFQNFGPAPEFSGISNWINSNPLSIKDLKGKVVLIDFWTFSCINCIRTLPYVTKWYDTYKDQGLVVVGVHTPEFAFEKDTSNVADAVKRFNINYPVAQDNEYGTWNAYNNQYWPAEYLIDKNGNIVYTHFGEGEYDHTENAIRQLLGQQTNVINPMVDAVQNSMMEQIGSPEMYFEPQRLQNLAPEQKVSTSEQLYTFPDALALNNFALSGYWQFSADGAMTTKPGAKIRLKFHSGKLYMVAQSQSSNDLNIVVDGKQQPNVTVTGSKLYTIFDSNDYTDHTVEITIPDSGFEAFTFTFG